MTKEYHFYSGDIFAHPEHQGKAFSLVVTQGTLEYVPEEQRYRPVALEYEGTQVYPPSEKPESPPKFIFGPADAKNFMLIKGRKEKKAEHSDPYLRNRQQG